MRTVFLGAILSSVLCSGLTAQAPPPSAARNRDPVTVEGLQVWLITVGQGEYVWEKFGHNALWFVDTIAGVDVAYNWGIFDFAQPGFLRRFLTGDTRYWVEGYPAATLIDYYRRSDRDVLLQRLNLSPREAARAYEYAQWNAREENKFYRYDYFRDNCSTRVRDVVDLALGGALKRAAATDTVPRSYRSESLRLVDDMKLTQLGMDVALGQPADRRLSVWDDMFIPMRMRDALKEVRVTQAGGSVAPLVLEERSLYRSRAHRERQEKPRLGLPYLIVGLLLAAGLAITARMGERSPLADTFFRIETIVWAAVVGMLGTVLLLAWIGTQHVFWYRNENVLLISPLGLWLAVLTAMSMRRARWLRPAAICAVVIALLSALALILKGIPGFGQDNVPIVLLVLPAHLAVAHGLWRRAIASIPPAAGHAWPGTGRP